MSRLRPLTLCYHAVSPTWPHRLAVRPDALARQVRSLLLRGYRGATARETLERGGRRLHVTFDDAFRNVELALPALERMRVPVTIFACASYADDGRAIDIPELAGDDPGELATMTWDTLRALAGRGVEIGSHTLSHPHLPKLSDEELDRELRESKARIEDELGRPCPLFAYPYGEHGERVRAAARRAGYDAAYVLEGWSRSDDRFAVPRVDLYRRDTLARAVVKTSFLYPALARRG